MSSSLRRLAKDHAALRQSLPPNYLFVDDDDDATAQPDDLTQLTVWLTGPDGTPYSQGLWKLHLKIPNDYPKNPPKATFKTRIYHPNIEEHSGNVCLETLKRDWDSKLTLKDILITISCLLIQPNPDSALNAAAGALVQEDFDAFSRQAKLMTSIHAPIPKHLDDAVREAQRRGEEAKLEKLSATEHTVTRTSDHTMEPKLVLDETNLDCRSKTVLGKRSFADRHSPIDQDMGKSKAATTASLPCSKHPDKIKVQKAVTSQMTYPVAKLPSVAQVSSGCYPTYTRSDNLHHIESKEFPDVGLHETNKENFVTTSSGETQTGKMPIPQSSELKNESSLRKVSDKLSLSNGNRPRRGIRRL